ncbi:MAG TPA: DUF4881 domain-containing protein [Candidatus Desulfovibrio intestinipullorum]|uniref:DUF4881 domain-containing protein n=1 Tax=Candidatus Desulfovibrio intestinipullorum TaxID=2838536 RepID=A0A9D1PWW8_9BACT|nr:DUF4881 domain-containing protein [Candidatus Desulfovibrio intestinipullorum]
MRTYFKILALFVLCLGLAACEFGQVEQGRCVAYDAKSGKFTLVLDVNHDVKNPSYTGGVIEYTMPADPEEIGPEPVPGGRVQLLPEKGQVIIFHDGKLETLNVEYTDIQKNIKPHNPKVEGHTFPIINKDEGTVTEYSRRLEEIVTFKVPAEYLELPPSTWEAGDECRIYYKENAKHQALRFMNVSKTNIFKK